MRDPILEERMRLLRHPETRPERFRRTLEEIGYHIGLQIAEDMPTKRKSVKTLMGEESFHEVVEKAPILVSLLRAGLPLHAGIQRAFPQAKSGFIGTARDEETLKSKISYSALPCLEGEHIILIDTMIATGGSILEAVEVILQCKPRSVTVAGALASKHGMEMLRRAKIRTCVAVVDPDLTVNGFIVPGLGDAGDRCYGEKQA